MAQEDVFEERDMINGARDQRKASVTTHMSAPGPSKRLDPVRMDITSQFNPKDNVNLCRITEGQLASAGINDGHPGPGVIVSLAQNESLAIAGLFLLTPLQHALSIYSTVLSPSLSSFPVYAPTSHPLPVISPASTQASGISPVLNNIEFPLSFQKDFDRTLLLIRENRCGIDGLRNGTVPGFSNIWLEDSGSWELRGVHPVVGSFPVPVYPYYTPPSWSRAISSLSSSDDDLQTPFVGLVKGPKRSGKSTFARALINNLLRRFQKVAWLECDLGQGEFGCGAVVGLWILDKPVLGPPFTHPLLPSRSHYLGTYTPLTCPDEYLAAIRHLIEHYKYELQYTSEYSALHTALDDKIGTHVPLVINTQGWMKGLGEDLLNAIESMAQPTRVFSFESQPEEIYSGQGWTSTPPWQAAQLPYDPAYPTTFPVETESTQTYTLETAPVSALQARYTPADLRVLSTITYFHASLHPTQSIPVTWDLSSPLVCKIPWEVELGTGKALEKVYLIGEGSEGVLEEDLPIALNGAIVALAEMLGGYEDQPVVYEQGRSPPPADSINFLGLAVIRSLSSANSVDSGLKLQLLTPLPPSYLSRVRILIKNGALELPLPGMTDWRRGGINEEGMLGKGWEEVPFLDVGGPDIIGGERRRFRKNIMRKGM